jgi:small subunit ribosomal protein S12
MPTVNQMVRKGRKNSKTKSKAPALQFTLNSFKQRVYGRTKVHRRNAEFVLLFVP